jgi:uncharacterized membrane protein|tara:strand:+ start:134 stop:352 length:219 start_codon:yes stop_codon:yes gene_type:complete
MIASLIGILAGFILIMLGLILGVHSDHKVISVLIMFAGLVSMVNFLPQYDNQNDRLRRYERQHQKWLRGKHD